MQTGTAGGSNGSEGRSALETPTEERRLRRERIALKICDALEQLDGHHDLNPEKIMVDGQECIKVPGPGRLHKQDALRQVIAWWWERRTRTCPTRQCHELGWEKAESREVMMLDIFYVALVIAFFVLLWGFTKASERLQEDRMEYVIAGIVAVFLFFYLLYALLRPERF